jgi:hypothetical protein
MDEIYRANCAFRYIFVLIKYNYNRFILKIYREVCALYGFSFIQDDRIRKTFISYLRLFSTIIESYFFLQRQIYVVGLFEIIGVCSTFAVLPVEFYILFTWQTYAHNFTFLDKNSRCKHMCLFISLIK